MPKIQSGRGKSPATRKAVAESNAKRKVERLRREIAEIAKEESDRLLAQSPLAVQIIFHLQALGDDRSVELADYLQTLLVEQAYTEAVVDGVIVVGDSYIA